MKNIYLLHRQIGGIFNCNSEWDPPITWVPFADVYETSNSYYVVMEIPGLSEDKIVAEVQGRVVKISGDRKTKHEECRYHQIERGCGGFLRSFLLPQGIDQRNIKALLKDGILMIEIAKEQKDSPINLR